MFVAVIKVVEEVVEEEVVAKNAIDTRKRQCNTSQVKISAFLVS